ncbi:MAG: hypothetical protein ABW022_05030, partial [Actinoplanes sp.]
MRSATREVGWNSDEAATRPSGASGPSKLTGRALRWLPLAGAPVALWSVRDQQVDNHGDIGLPPELPLIWYFSLAAVTAGAGVTLAGRHFDRARSAAYLTGLVAVLYGTILVAADVPRYPWVYKHIGVARYIDLHGSIDWSIDIYHRWPGFFSL